MTLLVGEGNALYASQEFDGAVEKFSQALAQKPTGAVLGYVYRGLGTAYAQKKNAANTVKYFKLYLPFASDADKPKLQGLINHYQGQL